MNFGRIQNDLTDKHKLHETEIPYVCSFHLANKKPVQDTHQTQFMVEQCQTY